MYTLIRHARIRDWLWTEAPALLLSFGVAEVAFKFHSFTLECLCFLLTWLALSAALSVAGKRLGAAPTGEP